MIVDTYTRTKLIGGYTKTPTPSVQKLVIPTILAELNSAEHVQSAGKYANGVNYDLNNL